MIRLLFRITLILLLLAGTLILGRNTLALWLMNRTLEQSTGLSMESEFINISLTRPRFAARDVTLYNPKSGFRERVAMKIPFLELDYNPLDLFRGNPHFSRVVVDVAQLNLVENATGHDNLEGLRKNRKFQIDQLEFSLGTASLFNEKILNRAPYLVKVGVKNRIYKNVYDTAGVEKIVTDLVRRAIPGNLSDLMGPWLNNTATDVTNSLKETGQKIKNWFQGSEPAQKNH